MNLLLNKATATLYVLDLYRPLDLTRQLQGPTMRCSFIYLEVTGPTIEVISERISAFLEYDGCLPPSPTTHMRQTRGKILRLEFREFLISEPSVDDVRSVLPNSRMMQMGVLSACSWHCTSAFYVLPPSSWKPSLPNIFMNGTTKNQDSLSLFVVPNIAGGQMQMRM